jgi:hypothetical protein
LKLQNTTLIGTTDIYLYSQLAYSSAWGTWGVSRLLFLSGSEHFSPIGYGAPTAFAKSIASVLKMAVIAIALTFAWRRRGLDGIGLAGTVGLTWVIFFVFTPGWAPQYAVWPLVPLLLDRVRLGVIYLIAATPLVLIAYPFTFDSMLPAEAYRQLVAALPNMGARFRWSWPALILWTTVSGILVFQWKRWWCERLAHETLPP